MIINNKNSETLSILEKCDNAQWNAEEGAVKENAMIVIDVKCPIKMKEIEIINGAKEFSTKDFSLFGSHNSTVPWSWIYTGEIMELSTEVRSLSFALKFYHILK